MSIETQLNDTLKQSMKDKDQQTLGVVRMLKTKIMEKRTSKGFTGEITDEIALEVISAYKKQMQKALEEYEKLNATTEIEQLKFEIQFCEKFLPKGLDDTALAALVKERIGTLGITDVKQMGKLLGDIMKTHKGQVDANNIKKIAESFIK